MNEKKQECENEELTGKCSCGCDECNEGDATYLLLCENEDSEDAFLFKVDEDENGELLIKEVEDENEYERVSAYYFEN